MTQLEQKFFNIQKKLEESKSRTLFGEIQNILKKSYETRLENEISILVMEVIAERHANNY